LTKSVDEKGERTSSLRQIESAFSAILMLGEGGPRVTWMKITVEIDAATLILLVLSILAFLRY
jgi:hypothetical protein